MPAFAAFLDVDLFSSGHYRLVNTTLPVCLLDSKDGGDAGSDALTPATLTISGGKIHQIATGPQATVVANDNLPAIDLDGGMIWPVCADLHTHLDKGQTWFRAPNTSGSWQDALAIVGKDREANWSAEDVAARMDFALRCAFAHGTAALRTHIDSMGPQSAISWPVLAQMRDRWAGRIALQGVSLALLDHYVGKDGERLADLVAEHSGILGAVVIDDPEPKLERVFSLARDRDLDLDFHADETDNPNSNGLEAIAEATIRFGWQGRVTAGHCCSLAHRPAADAERTIARVAAAGVAVVSLPMCNMYLQDRQRPERTPRWRGVTLLKELAAAGVPVAVASDNTRDAFYAYGDLDPIEVFAQAVRIAQLDSPLGGWARAITATPAGVMSTDITGLLGQGQNADLILFHARSWSELLSRPRGRRLVIRNGRPLTDGLPDYRELDSLHGNHRGR
ncbi:MAG: cytosine deaminase [Xanthobacteraceae bacterium]